jgi:chromosome segregation ATPase
MLDVASYEAARSNNTDTWVVPSPLARGAPDEAPTASPPAAKAAPVPVAPAAAPAADDKRAPDKQRPYDERRTHLEVSLHALSDNLREVEERLKRKGERLVEIEKTLAHAHGERVVVEQRARQLEGELAKARTAATTAEARVTELQRGLEEREAASRNLQAHDKDVEIKLALRDKALSLVQRDLTEAQGLAATYLETLRSAEGRRTILQDLSSSLYGEIDDRDTKLSHVGGQLTSANARVRDLESKLIDRGAQLAQLERELGSLRATVAQRDGSLRETTRSGDELKRSVGTLTETLTARDERIRTLEAAAAAGSKTSEQRRAEHERIAAERTTLIESVNGLESKLAEANTRGTERDAAARTAQARCEELEQAAAGQHKRTEQLESELATIRSELLQRVAALQEAGTQRNELTARIAAGEARAKELEHRMEEQQDFVRVLQADSNASVARAKELEGDLHAAEDMIHRLETELRGRVTRLEELEKTNREWRATVEEARNALTERDSLIHRLEEETANSAVLLGSIQQRLESTGSHEISHDGDKRLLIRSEGDSDVVHVLGRKTSVGRTPDNDLQIDAKFISRHHAVILAGPAHTIIEDLNSTNGVLVNGRRITRQTLKDGDSVVIGKTSFRFAVKAVADRRN